MEYLPRTPLRYEHVPEFAYVCIFIIWTSMDRVAYTETWRDLVTIGTQKCFFFLFSEVFLSYALQNQINFCAIELLVGVRNLQ